MLTIHDINDRDSPVAMFGASHAASVFVFSTEGQDAWAYLHKASAAVAAHIGVVGLREMPVEGG